METLREDVSREAQATASAAAAQMTQQMGTEAIKKHGPVQPWEVVPSTDTPTLRKARKKMRERGQGRGISVTMG